MRTAIALAASLLSFAAIAQTGPKTQTQIKTKAKATKGTIAALDEKYGFRDVAFGQKVKPGKDGFMPTGTINGYPFFSRATDRMEIGTAKLDSIGYGLYEGKVTTILIVAKGDNLTALVEALKAAYGEPEPPIESIPYYTWFGSRVIMQLKRDEVTGDGAVTMSSIPLVLQRDAAQKKAATAAADDL